jgi:uncharacterized repeat protein (TIGR03803 family)
MNTFSLGMRACGVFLFWATTAVALPAPTLTTLHRFDATDGYQPNAALIQGTDGNLYGMTAFGGAHGEGTVFKITPGGKLTTLYDFCSQSNCTDGAAPYGIRLVQATNGDFYGTTSEGGASGGNVDLCGGVGCGTVFKITPSGKLTTLYSFCSQGGGNCTDGTFPNSLVQGTDGNLYGTASGGGYNGGDVCHGYSGCGTVFKITPSGTLTTLHTFDYTDGANSQAALVQGTDGNFYGTTTFGVASGGTYGLGTVFKITPSGTLTTLYSFSCSQGGCPDGTFPHELIQATDGNFYGTTEQGGIVGCEGKSGCGTVFKITPTGNLTTLYAFGHMGNGNGPYAGLTQATDGNFYGTTYLGGGMKYGGTVFKITPSGELTAVYRFCSRGGYRCTDGSNPQGALLQDTNGRLYGTTYEGGGLQQNGTIFGLSVGLRQFVETQPTSGKVGRAVKILGTSLTGATSVTFNDTASTFTVVSASEITTTVPLGATTGTVQVVTPGGTLSSNVPFTVN